MKKWLKVSLGIVGGLLALSVLSSMFGGDDDATPTESGSPAQSQTQGDAPTSTGTAPPADNGCDGDRNCARLTILSAERKDCLGSSGGLCADSGTEYLLTRLKVVNTGTQEISTNAYSFDAHREGVTHDIDSTTFFQDGSMQSVTLQKGGSQEGTVIYKVPKGADVTEICYEPMVFTFGDKPRFCAPVE